MAGGCFTQQGIASVTKIMTVIVALDQVSGQCLTDDVATAARL
jgi:D-alanyl-D-alanine carboxypeptidase